MNHGFLFWVGLVNKAGGAMESGTVVGAFRQPHQRLARFKSEGTVETSEITSTIRRCGR